jgi:hypothetical protein
MKKLPKYLTPLILITSLSGCISVRSSKYSAIKNEELKVSSVKKSKVFIDWGFQSSLFGQTQQSAIDKIKMDQKNLLSSIIKETECCEIVNEKEEADILIKGAFHNETSNVGLAFSMVTGFSLYIVPSWMNIKMKVSANVKIPYFLPNGYLLLWCQYFLEIR